MPTATNTPTPTATPEPTEPGQVIWRVDTGGWTNSKPLVHEGTLYLGAGGAEHLYALDSVTGEKRWRYDLGTATDADPAAFGDVVLIGDRNGRIHAVSGDTGARLWITEATDAGIHGSVSTEGKGVFVAHKDGRVTAVALDDGASLWQFTAGEAIYGGTTVSNGFVYVTSYDDWVYALDAASGEILWKTELMLGSSSTPMVVGNLVIVGSWDERVYALDAQTGEHLWNFWAGAAVPASVAAFEDSLYFGANDGYLYSISVSDGALEWRYEISGEIRSTPAVADGMVYVGANDGVVYALNTQTGSLVWQFQTGDKFDDPLAVFSNSVYATSDDGYIYALAGGFPDGYVRVPAASTPLPAFTPLTRDELIKLLAASFGTERPVSSRVTTYGSDGERVEQDGSAVIIEIFENGYYLLTGRTVQQDGWEARYYSVDDYNALAEEREDPELKRARGWCCIRTEDGLALIMRANVPLAASTAITAHEAGHALQRLINPVQRKAARDSLVGALREAQAYTFEVALTRKIGEYIGVEVARWPSGYDWAPYLDQWRQAMTESVDDLTQEHDRGRLIMWQAVLNDPELAHLREELIRDGHVSADSMMDMYHRFVRLTPSEVESYVESITVESLSDDLNFIFGTVYKRTGFWTTFPELVLNVPTLVVSP